MSSFRIVAAPAIPASRRRPNTLVRRVDWVLALAVATLVVVGALLVWSATRQYQLDHGANQYAYLEKHLFNAGVGLVLAVAVASVDYRLLRTYASAIYGLSLLGLAAVLVAGSTINGARSWIVLPAGFELQPSELAKVALIVVTAIVLGAARTDTRTRLGAAPGGREVLAVLLLAAPPLGLIMLQPDFGTTMVFVMVLLGMLTLSGAPARYVLALVASGIGFGFAVLHLHLLKPYQVARLTEFARHSTTADSGVGYNVNQAMIANAHGGFFGRGLLHGSQTQGQFVPEQKTDFVFTVAGEELGFVGAALSLVLLGLVLWRAAAVAQRADDSFGTLVCAGVIVWFAFQAFVNIGMTLGIMPVTGLPLPFLSYGGSSMFANMLAIGLVENVRLRSPARQ